MSDDQNYQHSRRVKTKTKKRAKQGKTKQQQKRKINNNNKNFTRQNRKKARKQTKGIAKGW